MGRLLLAALLLAVVWLAACGADQPGAGSSASSTSEVPTSAPLAQEQLYEVDTMVVDAADGPMACLGMMRLGTSSGVVLSPTPQCGTVRISNWDWDAVEGEKSVEGTSWGAYHVVGTYEGGVLRVTEIGPFETVIEPEPFLYENPCPAPGGGWVVPDPEQNTQEETRDAHAYAKAQPDYVISWNDHLDEELQEFSPVVFVAAFTGEAERHEAEIRELWEGPLCVVERNVPTARELAETRREIEARLPELGLELLGSATGGLPPTISIDVVIDPGGAGQAALDQRYGPGMVRLFPALRPVE
jgi:hypothetical protein